MNSHPRIWLWAIYLAYSCMASYGLLRHYCQVLEKKYFAPFLKVTFPQCADDSDFTIAANCDGLETLNPALREVPLATDWLCLSSFYGVTLEANAFSQFKNLNTLYITFEKLTFKTWDIELQARTFSGLTQLTKLWIELLPKTYNITFHEDTFYGLNSLQELQLTSIPIWTFDFSIFNHVNNLDSLILAYNDISSLSKVTKSLEVFKKLDKLSIVMNNIYEITKSDCLSSSTGQFMDFNISYLEINQNPITTIEANSLCNFPHLKQFKVDKTAVDVKSILDSGMKSIKIVSILNTVVTGTFHVCKYASRFRAEELLIKYTYKANIDTFDGTCKHLKKLDLTSNNLSKLGVRVAQSLNNVEELNLSNNNIEHLKICANETAPTMKLVVLNVSFNKLLVLSKGSFACLKVLRILSLENNGIRHIRDFAFDGLEQLEVLNLQNNHLFTITEFTFSSLPSVKKIDLYENALETIDMLAFANLSSLQDISLTYSYMVDLAWWSYLEDLMKHVSVKAEICDILDEFLIAETIEIDAKSLSSCPKFLEARELHLKNLIVVQCTDTSLFEYCSNLEELYYVGNPNEFLDYSLDNTLKNLTSLKFLYLEDTDKIVKNHVINVYTLFEGLDQLKVLHLKNSGIDRLDSSNIFGDLHELEFLLIEDQNFQEVTETAFESLPNLKYIYLRETTFPCTCKLSGLLSWLKYGSSVSIINFHDQKCQLNQNTTNIISFVRNNCGTELDLILFVATFIFTLLFICSSFLYESIWWYSLYIVYAVKCWLNRRKKDRDGYEYDVFVSYNTNDELWVLERLLPNLEVNGISVCIHNRDFEIGRAIVENIMDSIYRSRWTACIITRSYLQSNWCSLEMRMATYRLLEESKESLIIIFLDKISREELQHYHRLTKLLDKKTYLEWPDEENMQQLFWTRLCRAVAKSGRIIK